MKNPSQSYGASPTVRDHTVTCHPTQMKAPHFNPRDMLVVLDLPPPGEMGSWISWPWRLVAYRDGGLPACKQSPILIVTTCQWPNRELNPRLLDHQAIKLLTRLQQMHDECSIKLEKALGGRRYLRQGKAICQVASPSSLCQRFPYAPFNAMVTKISKWSRIQDSFRIIPKIESLVVYAMPDIPSKFQKDPYITFRVILLTHRQTDKLKSDKNITFLAEVKIGYKSYRSNTCNWLLACSD